jgi:DNA-binding SARP family transcriptional activator
VDRRVSFGILGPFVVEVDEVTARLGGRRQRSVLALLLLDAGRVVSVSRLIDALWEGRPPPAAESTLRGYVSHLRKALAPDSPLTTRASGYQLTVNADSVDATRFERLLAEGRNLHRSGDHAAAADVLRAALGLWRGPALADFADESWARVHCARLEELRQVAIEARVDADLALGRHQELVGELNALVAEYPLREHLHARRMLALYRSGRQADALAAYRDAYEQLAGAQGLDPGGPLRELEAAILRQDPALDLAPVRATVPAELPADVATFTGRAQSLADLDAAATGAAPTVVISAIAGAAGVGKTALAVHWAHRVAGRFPDGQLYVNLHGYGPGPPVRPVDALARFLRALGVPADQVPIDVDEAAARYRTALAGRQVLVVLDNAADAAQVRPLLPGARGCAVVVTSRDRLTGLVARDGAVRLALDVLSADESGALLGRILGADRVRTEPDAVAELTRLCGHLPLALRIAAANLLQRPRQTIVGYVDELRAGDRLDALAVDGDEQSAVRAAFGHSYRHLPEPDRRLFRLLGLVPGADVTAESAAALTGAPDARRALDRLTAAHLLDQHSPGRYSFHDLLRLYAAERARHEDAEAERRAALTRLLDHYRTSAVAAMNRAFPEEWPGRPDISVADTPADPAQARSWLDAARANLVAAAGYAAEHGWPEHARDLASTLWLYLTTGPHYAEAIVINTHALHAARDTGDQPAEGDALTNLGAIYWRTGRPEQAREHLERALAIRRDTGDARGEGYTLHHLASLSWNSGRYRQFHERCGEAVAIFRTVGDRLGLVKALNNLAMVYWRWGRCAEGIDHAEEAVTTAREVGFVAGVAVALDTLSLLHQRNGDATRTREYAEQALTIAREIGARYTETSTLITIGWLHAEAGRYAEALDSTEQALTIARVIDDRHLEAAAQNSLGTLLTASGRPAEAPARHASAQAIAREADDRDEEAGALAGLAAALDAAGRPAEAVPYWRGALAIYAELDVPEADEIRARLAVHTPH